MAEIPPGWIVVSNLPEGGQAHTYVVKRKNATDTRQYVLKRLKNSNRNDYFEREIQVCTTLDHPNILKILEHDLTSKGKPYFITEYCDGGSLKTHPVFGRPAAGLRFFLQIVAGVAQAHSREHPIYHLDLKPENIFVKEGRPVVGDWGICFIEDEQVTITKEGPRGSKHYCPPELRGPKISDDLSLSAADVYSLGKLLYFLFTKDVYDGDEKDYSDDTKKALAHLKPSDPQFA